MGRVNAQQAVAKRLEAIDDIRDKIEFGRVDSSEAEELVRHLLKLLEVETHSDVREDILDAVSLLTLRFDGLETAWDMLVSQMPTMSNNELEFAIDTLAMSGDTSFCDTIKLFLTHEDAVVRRTAAGALAALKI